MKKPFKNIAVTLLGIICTASFAGGLSACKKRGPIDTVENKTTVRETLPTDGSLPTEHTALENIGYMATVLDNQPFYHAYAKNSTKAAMGYEQVTQTWKDYKNAQLSGVGKSVMVCSDLSYSSLIKSSTQSCFVGGTNAYMRNGNKPEKTSVATDINWSTDQPTFYDTDSYLYKYGEFSTELSVYVIDKDTVDSADDVVDNGDGTYTQKYYLNQTAGCWYQYGMKTRGGLKGYPEYKKIEISFTFDSKWQVLNSYCEEKASIAPNALGGISMDSNAKTTTTFYYGESDFDDNNYAYFENYYKEYLDKVIVDEPSTDGCEHEILDILGGGFSKVMTAEGQQFALNLKIGETDYDGKVYVALPDMSDVLGTLEIRLQLGKSGSGNQDLYIEFKNGAVNVYYANSFAMSADINEVSGAVGKFTEWVKEFDKAAKEVAILSEDTESSSIDLTSLLTALKCTVDENSATIALVTDDLLGLGIGTDVKMNFSHVKGDDGCTFAFKDLSLNDISYNGSRINLSAGLATDGSAIISREVSQTPADLAEYMNSVYALLNSKSLKVDLGVDGLVEGLALNATAYLTYASELATNVSLDAKYKDLTAKLNAYYVYDGGYGKVYINLTEFNGNKYDAKVYCDVQDTVQAVEQIMGWADGISALSDEEDEAAAEDLAAIINKVLGLNFEKIITGLSGNSSSIGITLDADELLGELGVDLGIKVGVADLKLFNGDDGKASLAANLDEYGIDLSVSGSDEAVKKPAGDYVDVVKYINSVYAILNSNTLKAELGLNGLVEGLTLNATAYVNYKDEIATKAELKGEYEGIDFALNAYYVYDGGYGKVYINLTGFNGNKYDAKVYCDIKDAVDSVKQIIAIFGNSSTTALSEEQTDELANAIAYALSLNYNEIIKADNTSLKVTVDVDEILGAFGVEAGMEFGKAVLTYNTNSTLTANVEELGLTVKVSGSDEAVKKPAGDYVDVVKYINSVYAILNSNTLKAELGLNGLVEGLTLNATAYVNYKDEIATKAELKGEYEGIDFALNAYYVYDGGYGKVYINLTGFNGNKYDAKVYCDIKDAVDSVKQIIALFGNSSTTTLSEEQTDELANAIAYALSLNYNEIIKADNTSLKVTVDVDEILGAFGVEAGMEFGKAVLTYNTNSTLTANVEELGLTVKVSGSDEAVKKPAGDYVDVVKYINSVYAILNSNTLKAELGLNSLVEGLTLNATAYVNYKDEIATKAELKGEYEGIDFALNAYYVYDGGYGKVYINLTGFNGNKYDAKVYCDIKDAVDSVKQIIAIFGNSSTTALSEEQTDELANAIAYALSLNYNEIIKADNTSLKVTVDVDEILGAFGIEAGMEFGKAVLTYNTNSTLTANVEELGLTVKVSGSEETIKAPAAGDYVDVVKYINSVYELLCSESYKISLNFDGGKLNLKGENATAAEVQTYLKGATLGATVYAKPSANFKSVEVQADLTVTYYGNEIKLGAYYVYDNGYGDVYLNLTEFNGVKFDAKVYCDVKDVVEEITNLINIINGSIPATVADENGEPVEGANIAKIVKYVLSIDYASIIAEIKGTDSAIAVTVDADAIISLFTENLGVEFGKVSLVLGNANEQSKKASLKGEIPALGFDMGIAGSDYVVKAPEQSGYVNVTELVKLVEKATVEAQKIIEAQDITFDIDVALVVDGVTMSVDGKGEVCWVDGKISVAVDAAMNISEKDNTNTFDVKLVYDERVEDSDKPFVRFAINSLGMEICRNDVDGLVNDFNEIIDSITKFTGEKNEEVDKAGVPESHSQEKVSVDEIMELINTDNARNVIKAVLGFVSDLTVELKYAEGEEPDIYGLFIKHAINGSLKLSTNGDLALELEVNDNKGAKISGVAASVSAGDAGKLDDESVFADINTALNGADYTICNSSEKFIEAVYKYLFNAIDEKLSVREMLGGSTFTVDLRFNGADSAIEEIQNISVDASFYYTEGLSGDKLGSKLVETELKLNIGGTVVEVNVRYAGQNLYIELINIAGTQLDGMKFVADVHEIYSAAEAIVDIITSENLANIVTRFTTGGTALQTAVLSEESEETKLGVTEIFAKILALDFNKVVNISKNSETGENVLTLNPDEVLGKFGIGIQIGTVTASVNPETHKISATAKLDEKDAWLTVKAYTDSESKHGVIDTASYININFVSTFLKDAGTTLDGINAENIRFSLTGTISANLAGMADVVFKNVTLTVGVDENNELFVTMTGDLQSSKALLVVTVASASKVSVTYYKGYITFGRDVESSSPEYAVVTLDYLIDNMLDKNNSPLFWWLGTGSVTTVLGWFGLSSEKLGLSSGLTTPQTMYLYELAQAVKDNDVFYLASILNGFAMNTDGKPVTYNTGDLAVSALGLKASDRYYALDINGNGLTGGVVPTLYAAIMRDGRNGGISGLKAYVDVSGYIKATVNLNGVTTAHKDNYFDAFNAEAAINGYTAGSSSNHTTPIFGMYNSSKGYFSSNVLDLVTLKVVDENGEENSYELRYGSTVYLSSTFAPEWTDENKHYTYLYKDANGNVLGESIMLESDTTVYIYKVKDTSTLKKEIVFHTGIAGVGDVNAAFVLNENTVSLQRYELDGYTMLGWYSDEACTQPITDATAFDGTDVYCVYAKSNVTVNGVVYKLYNNNGVISYHVNGFDANGILPYTVSGSQLLLESSINGYAVTEIDVGALKLSNIKNVVVPATVTKVNADAFMDNKDMESAVFLADKVFFGGSSWTDDGSRYPFYGCGTSANEYVTVLNLYYKIAESNGSDFDTSTKGDTDWMGFKKDGSKKYYVADNGGSRNGWRVNHNKEQVHEGNYDWAYVNYVIVSVNNNKALEVKEVTFAQLKNINVSGLSKEEIALSVMQELNAATAKLGYINAYSVEVSGGVELNRSMYTVTITVTEKAQDEWYYRVNVASTVIGLSSQLTGVEGNYEVADGMTYVQTGALVTVTSYGDDVYNAFDGWTSSNANLVLENTTEEMTFTMPVGATALYSAWKADFANNVYVYSEVAFTYNGVEYGTKGVELTNAAVGRQLADAVAVENSKYAFLGWALANADNLLTVTEVSAVQSFESKTTYYAVWAEYREEVTAIDGKLVNGTVNPNAENSGVSVTVDTSKVAGFNKWYADRTFANELNGLTTATTVLYARMSYTLTVTVSSSSCRGVYIGDNKEESLTSKAHKITKDYVILEGETIYLQNDSNNKKDYYIGKITNSGAKENITGQIKIKITSGLSTAATESSAVLNDEEVYLTVESDNNAYSYSSVSSNLNYVFSN